MFRIQVGVWVQREGMGGLKFFVRIFRSVFLLVFVAHFLGCV